MTSLNDSLVRITKGAGIALVGYLVGLFFGFISRVPVAKYKMEDGIMVLFSYLSL